MFFVKRKWLIILAVILVIAFGVASILLVQKRNKIEIISAEISVDSIANAPSVTEEKTVELSEEKKDAVMEGNKKEEEVMEEEVDISQINVKVFNEGAPAGSAGKVKDMLISEGYAKSEASNGESENFSGSVVVFGDDKFQKNAQLIVEVLSKENIKAEVRGADTDEERSADIVIILGK